MTDLQAGVADGRTSKPKANQGRRNPKRRRLLLLGWTVLPLVAVLAVTWWLGTRASLIRDELTAAARLLPQLQQQVLNDNGPEAAKTILTLKEHTATARRASTDPLWTMAAAFPGLGVNFEAATIAATSADDVARLAGVPLVDVAQSLNWKSLLVQGGGVDVKLLQASEPKLAAAAHAVRESYNRLDSVETELLLPQIASPFDTALTELESLRDGLDTAAGIAALIPSMMGAEQSKSYLLMVQNNAELRASGGIPGALAVVRLEQGKLSLGDQRSASSLRTFAPPIAIGSEESSIYSNRVGKFMQDVNLTANFPTAAETAVKMWEEESGEQLDGALSVDPIVLSYLMESTGPIDVGGSLPPMLGGSMPVTLTAQNVVSTLLSDVYKQVENPLLQDAYFATVAQKVFAILAAGDVDATKLVAGITRGTEEGRLLVWSADLREQATLAKYPISGSVSGPSIAPAQFGVYFNDGTGAKMDYYVKRTAQLIKECPRDGYEQTTVRITSTNTAPADAADSLPAYVTGGGAFGVSPGSVQTNVVAYGPVQANVETAKLDGQKTQFAPYLHSNRPVGVLAVRLAPGETKIVEFTFGKIVQHTEPNLVVTPTVEPVKDVILPTTAAPCS